MSDSDIFDVDNQNYIALVPVDNDDEVIFYRYFEDEEGNPSLENIDHDDEFDAVSDRSMSYWTKKNLIRCKLCI